jgi:hypothetical protein
MVSGAQSDDTIVRDGTLVVLLTRNLPEIWSILKDRARSQDAAKVSEGVDQAVAADQGTRIDCRIAADLYSITDDRAELA